MRKRNNRVISFVLTLMMLITAMTPLGSIAGAAETDQVLDFVELAKTTKYVGSDYDVTVDDSGITITLTKDISNNGEAVGSCNYAEATNIIDVGSYGRLLNASANSGTPVAGEEHYVMIPGEAFDVVNNPYLHAKITGAESNSTDASWSFALWYLGYQADDTKKVSVRESSIENQSNPEWDVFKSLGNGVTKNGNFVKGNLTDYHSTAFSDYMIDNGRANDFKYQALVLKVIGKVGDSFTISQFAFGPETLPSTGPDTTDQVLDFVELAKTTKYVGSDYDVTVDDSGITITLTKDISNNGEAVGSCNYAEATSIIDVGSYGRLLNASANGGTPVAGEEHYVMIPGEAFDVVNNPYLHAKITGAESNSTDASWSFALWYLGYQADNTKKVSVRESAIENQSNPEWDVFKSLGNGVTKNGNFIKGNLTDYHSTAFSDYMIDNGRANDFKYQALVLKVIGKAGDSFTISQFAFGPETLPSTDPEPPEPTEPTELIYNFYSRYQIHQDGTYDSGTYHTPRVPVAECTYEKIAECNAKLNTHYAKYEGVSKPNYTSPLPAKATGDWCVISESPDNAFGVNNKDVGFFTVTAGSSISIGIKVPVAGNYDMSPYMRAYNDAQGEVGIYVAPVSDKDNCMDAKYLVNVVDTYRSSGFAQSAEFKIAYDKAFEAGEYIVSFKMVGTSSQSGAKPQAHMGVSGIVLTPSSAVAEAPTANPASGAIFNDTLDITLKSETPDAKIYYTTNGDEPTTSSTEYTAPITLTQTTIIKAIAAKAGKKNSPVATFSYKKKAAPATATPFNGFQFAEDSLNVKLNAIDGASIYYTVNGDTPTAASTRYSDGIIINDTTTIKALVVKDGMEDSDVAEFTYTKIAKTADPIVYDFRVFADVGTHTDLRTATDYTAVATANASLKTLSPSAMWCFGAAMDDATTVSSGVKDLGAGITPAGKWAAYRISVPQSGTYNIKNNFWNSGDTRYDGVINYYFNPVSADPIAESGKIGTYSIGAVNPNTQVTNTIVENKFLEAGEYYYAVQLVDPGYAWNAQLILEPKNAASEKVATPTANRVSTQIGGTYNVRLACETEGATIYYTTDGTEPTTSNSVFTPGGAENQAGSYVSISATTTLKAIAVKSGMDNSDVATYTYTKLDAADAKSNLDFLKEYQTAGVTSPDGTSLVKNPDGSLTVSIENANSDVNTNDASTNGVYIPVEKLVNIAETPYLFFDIEADSGVKYAWTLCYERVNQDTNAPKDLKYYQMMGRYWAVNPPAPSNTKFFEGSKNGSFDILADYLNDRIYQNGTLVVMGISIFVVGPANASIKVKGLALGSDQYTLSASTPDKPKTQTYDWRIVSPYRRGTLGDSATNSNRNTVYAYEQVTSYDMIAEFVAETVAAGGKSGTGTDPGNDYPDGRVLESDPWMYGGAAGTLTGGKFNFTNEDGGAYLAKVGDWGSFLIKVDADGSYDLFNRMRFNGAYGGITEIYLAPKSEVSSAADTINSKYLIATVDQHLNRSATWGDSVVPLASNKALTAGEYYVTYKLKAESTAGSQTHTWIQYFKIIPHDNAAVKSDAPVFSPSNADQFESSLNVLIRAADQNDTSTYNKGKAFYKTGVANYYSSPESVIRMSTVPVHTGNPKDASPIPMSISETTTFAAVAMDYDADNKLFKTPSDVKAVTYTKKGVQEKVAAPTATPGAGNFTSTQNVTLASSTPDAEIYYTTNGSTPTTSSTKYTAAIPVSSTMTIKAIAVKAGMTDSDVAEFAYAINIPANRVKTPKANRDSTKIGGKYYVKLMCDTDGASIYYTTNGSEPTTSSALWSDSTGHIEISQTTTLKVMAAKAGMDNSEVATYQYDMLGLGDAKVNRNFLTDFDSSKVIAKDGTRLTKNANGSMTVSIDVAISDTQTDVPNGGEGNRGVYIPVEAFNMAETPYLFYNIEASPGAKYAWTFMYDKVDPISNEVTSKNHYQMMGQYYDANPTEPVPDGEKRFFAGNKTGSFNIYTDYLRDRISRDGTLKLTGISIFVIGPKDSYIHINGLAFGSEMYSLPVLTPDKPLNSVYFAVVDNFDAKLVAGNTYPTTIKLLDADDKEISKTGATIQYTVTTGTDVVSISNTGVITATKAGSFTVKAEATLNGVTKSDSISGTVTAAPVTQKVATPTATPTAGTYPAAQSVTLSSATAGAEIYYTTNGSTPTTSSTKYSGAISVSTTTTIKAIAVKSGMTNSDVATFAYTINIPVTKVMAPTATPAAGSYDSAQSVTLSSATAGAEIYYTTNGSTPTTASTKYTGAIAVDKSMTIKAIAVKSGMTNSDVASFSYVIQIPSTKVATPTTTPASGTYFSSTISVSLNCATDGAKIYYTLNGDTPKVDGESTHLYSNTPITITATTTVKAIAVKDGMDNSDLMSAIFQYYVPSNNSGGNYSQREFASAPVANPRAGTYEEAQKVTLTSATEGAVIYYTTDGTNPTTSSTRYTDAITVDKSMTIKAIATKTGMYGSAVSSFSYTIGSNSIVVPPSEDTTFHDVSKSDWYYDAVTYVNEKGLFNGVSATEFGPNLSTTRAMLATVINRMAGNPTASGEAPFADVSSRDWFAAGVAWASETGIVNGIGNQKFAPNSPITREQLCAMLMRYAEYAKITLPETENITFNDANQISDYAKNAVDVMSKAGIIKGKNGGNFDPKGLATRAEVATMIYRFVKITSASSVE